MRLLGQLFFGVRGSKSIVDTLLLRIFPSDQKQKSRNCIKFADVNFLVLNVDSRREKKIKVVRVTQNQGNKHQTVINKGNENPVS